MNIQDEIISKIKLFSEEMTFKMIDNVMEKGDSWKKSHNSWLRRKLLENFECGNWVDVANYAFMLDDKKREKTLRALEKVLEK